ncbi:hypothetical protein [uncultured Thiocystis sp.]|jgi:hypothetical protein|uniref:hypothetical protein n=1 Tax=uncultured Thiocystis sp. TaxID=1202134 RepID=UPI0025FF350F|nr:hypothetical protein [uncultured Thiocystis sp.]
MTEGRYSAHGVEAEFEPGSRKRVLRNRLGVVRVREMQQVESEAQIAVRKWAVSHFGPSHRSSSADFRELHGRLSVSASMFLKSLKIPSMADELAALRRMAASRRFGSRNHTLHSNNESFITPPVCQSPNVVLHSVVNKHATHSTGHARIGSLQTRKSASIRR